VGHKPVSDLVVQAWLTTVPELTASMIGAALPAPSADGTIPWTTTGFVQCTVAGGQVEDPTGRRTTLAQIDCWATRLPTSRKLPWALADQLAEHIIEAARAGTGQEQYVDVGPAGTTYDQARILTVLAVDEPRRVPNDPAGYARFMHHLTVTWIRAG
jgi:hypothetical protein